MTRNRRVSYRSLLDLERAIVACRACPRLVAWREEIAREKRRAYAEETYWGKPVPSFGDPGASLLIVGLAPGAHGANRTGRVFTGDRSGDFLYAALHRAGVASRAESVRAGDGLELRGAWIAVPCRCAPPDNRPTPDELRACAPFFEAELALLPDVRAVLALGKIAFDAALERARAASDVAFDAPPFAHGAELGLPSITRGGRPITLIASYHVSQQNTQTGRLTPAMFDAVLARALDASRAR